MLQPLGTITLPAGTYAVYGYARTDSTYNDVRALLYIEEEIIGYISAANVAGQGDGGTSYVSLPNGGNIRLQLMSAKAMNGWMGHIKAVRIK